MKKKKLDIHFQVKEFGLINWVGLWTLYEKEVKRFLSIYLQSMVAPMVTTLLFFAIFALALGGGERTINGVNFMTFLAPGIIVMAVAQNAFVNSSISLVLAKVQGNIVDSFMPPLSYFELAFGWLAAAVTRGLMVGICSLIALEFFYPVPLEHPMVMLLFAVLGSAMLGLLGVATGIWAEKFDHVSTITNFVVTPLAFLSGTFYSIDHLPQFWQDVTLYNPFFYMIDGFRYGFIGYSDVALSTGIIWLSSINIALWLLVLWMLKTGYKIRS